MICFCKFFSLTVMSLRRFSVAFPSPTIYTRRKCSNFIQTKELLFNTIFDFNHTLFFLKNIGILLAPINILYVEKHYYLIGVTCLFSRFMVSKY